MTNLTAKQLKKGTQFKRQGILFTVANIENDKYKNGTPCLNVSCYSNGSNEIDSFFSFKLDTKI